METNKILEVTNMVKIYNQGSKNQFQALTNINLDIFEGEFLCIMGPSGSGKSTLVNNISTIDIPSKGNVLIDHKNVLTMTEHEKGKFRYEKLGFVFQDNNLLQELTVYENIITPLYLQKMNSNDIKERVLRITKLLNIDFILEKFPNECSGGQRQRVAIARALVTNPKLLIADEPTGNLDSKNSHEVLSIFKKLNEEENIAIIMVTHDPQIASYSSRFIYIKDGQISKEIKRLDKTQKEYFYEIVKITTSDTQKLFVDWDRKKLIQIIKKRMIILFKIKSFSFYK